MKITNLNILIKIVKCDFSKIIIKIEKKHINEFKIFFIDNSFLNIWFSLKIKKRYSYHCERMKIDNTIFRHDNIPHPKWKYIKTFPKHFHNKNKQNVEESYISDKPEKAIVEMMNFIKKKLNDVETLEVKKETSNVVLFKMLKFCVETLEVKKEYQCYIF